MRRLTLLVALLVTFVLAPTAAADTVTAQDREGRTIAFDVRADGVDVEWYAELLRNAAHGNEITRLTVRVVAWDDLRLICGSGAAGCYNGRTAGNGTITVPAGKTAAIAHTVIHEYGHHLDAHRGVAAAAREPNGSAGWWAARGITELLANGSVSHTYSLGWERAIGEIFAEDYVALHLQTTHKIRWLGPPDEAVRAALRADLENVPAAPAAAPVAPLVIDRNGRLRAGHTVRIPFGLLGPGRRVTFTATSSGAGRIELRCSDGRRAAKPLAGAARRATIDLRNLGPASCTVTLRSTARTATRYTARLRLAVEAAQGRR